MRTIAIINQKGGSGKTTTAINLAAAMAAKGRKTLLVDMDPQSHCAVGLAVPESQIDRSMAEMLKAAFDGTMAFTDIIWQIARNLDLAPSTMALAGVEMELASAPDRDRRLAQILSAVDDQYEFCFVDCPPSIGLLTFNALRAAREVVIPVETGYFSLQGAIRQEATIQMLARRAGHHVTFKVLATMYDVRTKLAREILSELRRHFGSQLLPVVINFNSKLKEAASFGQPITEFDATSRGMQDFEKLANWLLANPPQPLVAASDAATGTAPGIAPGTAPASPLHQPPHHAQLPASLHPHPATAARALASPGMSRAAELVERARALASRTSVLASRLTREPEPHSERTPLRPPAPPSSADHPLSPPLPVNGWMNPPSTPALPPTLQTVTAPDLNTALAAKLARVYGVRSTQQGVLFVHPAGHARSVAIAGDFNGWDPRQTQLRLDSQLGIWQTCVAIPPGRYRYRLVLDGQWIQDPYNATVEANPFGELNNVVEVETEIEQHSPATT